MATFVYIDETGSVGTGGARQPQLILVAVMVAEAQVQALATDLKAAADRHIDFVGSDFEFHGNEIWHAKGYWQGKSHKQLLAAYEDAVQALERLNLAVAHATINKQALHDKYEGRADENAYRLALQFLLEKVDAYLPQQLKVLVADETKEQQMSAMKMVADMQQWGSGEVPGAPLKTVIDTMHFVPSHASPGVQLADLVAFVLQRRRALRKEHPDAEAALMRMAELIANHTRTYRMPWPEA